MTKIVSFRPGVASNRTAFEAMTLIYEYLQETYEYEFTVVTSTTDEYSNSAFDIESIPPKAWRSFPPHVPSFPRRLTYRRHVDPLIQSADGVLTVDPTIYHQGHLAINRASGAGCPIWFDTSATVQGIGPNLLWEFNRRLIQRSVKKAAGIIATVPKCLERFREINIFDREIASKFEVLGHPVDTETFAPAESTSVDGTRVIAVARLVPEKGLFYILEALDPLLSARDDLELALLGSGPMAPILEREVEKRNLDGSVSWLEAVSHDEVPRILNTADVYVNHAVGTNRWEEFFGVANLEAMACGVPSIVSDSGAIPYVIREAGRAVFVEQRDVIGLRQALGNLLDDEEKRHRLGQSGREYVVDNYSVPEVGEQFHRMLQRGL